jgi:hypothetical protein
MVSSLIHLYYIIEYLRYIYAFLYYTSTLILQDTRYIKYAEQKRNARNDRITVKYPA